MKFFNLLKKELRELLTAQTIITIIASMAIFIFLGQVMGDAMDDMDKESSKITICDQDNSELTKSIIASLDEMEDIEIDSVELESDNYQKELARLDKNSVIILPKGFSDTILKENKKAKIIVVGRMNSSSAISNISSSISTSFSSSISDAIQMSIISSSNLNADLQQLAFDPLEIKSITVVQDNSAEIDISTIMSYLNTQGFIIPVIVFVLVMFCSQMMMNAMATEKLDKTLETLLSTPVSRLSVLSSKLCAAGIVAALNAGAYMIGFSQFTKSLTMGSDSSNDNMSETIAQLGLKLQGIDFLLLGIQIFLTIMITLCISLILGAMAKDIKSSQTLILPITFSAMIPYMLSFFTDIKSLPIIGRVFVYMIPYTHTFTASDNILFNNNGLFLFGILYQLAFLAVCMFFALRLFMTDKIFTMSISLGNKDKKKRKLFAK